jgi:hypothetical protein
VRFCLPEPVNVLPAAEQLVQILCRQFLSILL